MPRKAVRSWIRAQSRASRLASLPVVFLGLLNTAAGIALAYALAAALAAGLAGRAPPPPVLALFAATSAVRAALIYAIDVAAFRAGVAGRRRLRGRLVGDLLAVGPALLRQRHSAALATALVDQIEALDGFYGRWLPAAALAVAAPVAVLAVVVQVDPVAAGLLAAVGLLVPFGQAVAGFGIAAASRGQFLALARLQARFLDRIRGIATIVLAGAAEAEAAALALAAAELRRRTMRVLRLAFLSSAVMDVANAAALVAVALHDRSKLAAGGADFTAALFVLLLVPEFFAPLRAFAAAYQDRAHVSGAAQALAELPTPPPPVPAAAIRTITARAIAVHVDDVWFAWDPARPPALAGLSFLVGPGETLVLAGPSGAGKSTIIELLLGFIRPDRGRVLLNGHDIADITPPALAALTAWIGQRPMLFAGTIRDNIRFARPDASEAEVEDAARLAHVAAFAAALPAGLDTPIGEGGHGLSGGQAQRVAIARAYLKQAPLLLLDEPTGHLDPATEQEVLASLRRLAVGRTVIMASHSAAAHALAGRRLDIVGGRVARRSEVA